MDQFSKDVYGSAGFAWRGPVRPQKVTYRLELYNLCRGGRAVGNGYYVAKVVDNGQGWCRTGYQRDFAGNEQAARQYLSDVQTGKVEFQHGKA
jgi:hypothetical protein